MVVNETQVCPTQVKQLSNDSYIHELKSTDCNTLHYITPIKYN